jgi:hypothetical protein
VGVREHLISRGIQWPGRVEKALTDLSYLTYLVPAFPAESISLIPADDRGTIAWSEADWATIAHTRSLVMGAFQASNFPQGLAYLDQLMGSMPEHPGLWFDRARGLAAMGRMPEARVAFEEVLRLDPGNKAVRAQLVAMGG